MKLIQKQRYLDLPDVMFDVCSPQQFSAPQLLVFNRDLFTEYGFSLSDEVHFLDALFENTGSSLALAYAGHQFGHYSPQLGDGRAHMLGQLQTADGKFIDVQLKGSGQTRYSRRGDGVATLGAIIREYIISEALAGLQIPTTRTLAIIGTGEQVMRDFQYQPGAIQVRTAQSHLRVGSFQYAYACRGKDGVAALADFAIEHHFPELASKPNKYAELLRTVAINQANLIVQWMSVGFIHGVMNTDNMALIESIDFGPCAFLDEYKSNKTFSSIDAEGRYAWNQQGQIGYWNLQRLAETLMPLFDDDKNVAIQIANDNLEYFIRHFQQAFTDTFQTKFGVNPDDTPAEFVQDSLLLLEKENVDFHCFFDALTQMAQGDLKADFLSLFNNKQSGENWLAQWEKIRDHSAQRLAEMRQKNPRVIARNHQVEKAITDITKHNDYTLFNRLCHALKHPYQLDENDRDLQLPPKENERVLQTFCGT